MLRFLKTFLPGSALICALLAPSVPYSSALAQHPELAVSENGRYLQYHDSRPFFWLGDTAWLLFQMTTRENADLYLKTRADEGFTVIQAAFVMGEERVGGTLRPNWYEDLPFVNGNPGQPAVTEGNSPEDATAYDYWDYADYVVERARVHGLELAVLPLFVGWKGDGYKYLNPENAEAYGFFLGRRYRDQTHLIWVLGGDNTPDTVTSQEVWERMARGITIGVAGTEDYSRTLMTYHINGNNSSSQWFHESPWLDFNMIQVWGNEKEIYPKVFKDWQRTPVKPAGLGEGSYENGPQYPTRPIDALKIRRQAYWSYLAGGYHTYGNTDTWNFGTFGPENTQDWKKSLHSPGAAHLSVLAKILTSLPWWQLSPDSTIFVSGAGEGDTRNVAMRSYAGNLILIYMAAPGTIELDRTRLNPDEPLQAIWIDPRNGDRLAAGEIPARGNLRFTPPESWPDALLLVEATGQ